MEKIFKVMHAFDLNVVEFSVYQLEDMKYQFIRSGISLGVMMWSWNYGMSFMVPS